MAQLQRYHHILSFSLSPVSLFLCLSVCLYLRAFEQSAQNVFIIFMSSLPPALAQHLDNLVDPSDLVTASGRCS